jgi:hypothetical protein
VELSFDFSEFDAFEKELSTEIRRHQGIDGSYTAVGYTNDSGYIESNKEKVNRRLTKVALAVIHEFGTSHIPERPFMRQAFDNNLNDIEAMSARLYQLYLDGKITKEQSLSMLGEWYAGVIKEEIRKGNFAPLAASTKKRKKSSKPLIDTGLNLLGGLEHKEYL